MHLAKWLPSIEELTNCHHRRRQKPAIVTSTLNPLMATRMFYEDVNLPRQPSLRSGSLHWTYSRDFFNLNHPAHPRHRRPRLASLLHQFLQHLPVPCLKFNTLYPQQRHCPRPFLSLYNISFLSGQSTRIQHIMSSLSPFQVQLINQSHVHHMTWYCPRQSHICRRNTPSLQHDIAHGNMCSRK